MQVEINFCQYHNQSIIMRPTLLFCVTLTAHNRKTLYMCDPEFAHWSNWADTDKHFVKKTRLCYKTELTLIYHNAACNHWLLALKHSSVAVFFFFFLGLFLTFFWFNLVCCFSFKNQFWLSKLDLKLHWRYYYRLHLRSHCAVPSESKGRQNVRLGDHSYIT